MSERMSLRAYARSRADRGLPGRDHKAVAKAIRTGRILEAVGDDGLIDPELADRLWGERTGTSMSTAAAPMEEPQHSRSGPVDSVAVAPEPHTRSDAHRRYAEARAKLTAAKAAQAELDLAEKRGQVIPAELHERRYAEFVDSQNGQLLTIVGRWAPHLIDIPTIAEAQAQLRILVNELLTELQNGDG